MTLEIYNKSVDTLLDAYNNKTLFHGSCNHCAVGTLLGSKIWGQRFLTPRNSDGKQIRIASFSNLDRVPESMIDELFRQKGFKQEELMQIENAFEKVLHQSKEGYEFWLKEQNIHQGQFIGLQAVLAVMRDMVDEVVNDYTAVKRLTEIYQVRKSEVVCELV